MIVQLQRAVQNSREIADHLNGQNLRPVSPDEVKITRDGDTAVFKYADDATLGSATNIKVGAEIHKMTDAELLQMHNDMAEAMTAERIAYDHVTVEVPIGKP